VYLQLFVQVSKFFYVQGVFDKGSFAAITIRSRVIKKRLQVIIDL